MKLLEFIQNISQQNQQYKFHYNEEVPGFFNFMIFDTEKFGKIVSDCTGQIKNKEMYIDNVATEFNYRDKGLGFNLIQNSIQVAKKEGLEKLTLDVTKNNQNAIRLYEKIGFNIVRDKRGEKLYKMELTL